MSQRSLCPVGGTESTPAPCGYIRLTEEGWLRDPNSGFWYILKGGFSHRPSLFRPWFGVALPWQEDG